MIHIMKLKEEYFNYIKYGTKEYEIRLNDEKRKNIKKGDFIEFQKEPLLEEKFIVLVDDLLYFNNFSELIKDINIKYLADLNIAKNSFISDLESFYSHQKQEKYGVVAIKIRKDIIINSTNLNKINSSNKIFRSLKENYNNFNIWLNKLKLNNINVYYTGLENEITSILILKINETDSKEFFEKGNILKIRTLLVNDKNKGIGTLYLKFIDNIAKDNNIKYIYVTIKTSNQEFIKFIEKNNYQRYNQINDEFVYYKEII